MSYQVSWHIPDCLVYVQMEGKVPAKEVGEVAGEVHTMMATVPHMVHMVVDSRKATMSGAIHEYAALATIKRAPNTGWIIVLGGDQIGGLLLSIFARMVGVSFVYKNTLEECVDFLAERDFNIKDYIEASLKS